MKTTTTLTTYIALAMLMICMAMPVYGQRTKDTTWEFGVSYTFPPPSGGSHPGPGIYVQTSAMNQKMTRSTDIRVGLTGFTNKDKESFFGLTMAASTNYHFNGKVDKYIGAGLGVCTFIDGIISGDLVFAPELIPRGGFVFWNRLSVTCELHVTQPKYMRGTLSIGYVF